MKQYRNRDFECPACGATSTRFVLYDTEVCAPVEPEVCGQELVGYDMDMKCGDGDSPAGPPVACQGVLTHQQMCGVGYMKTIVKGNSDFSERERARLEKRADDHWRRTGRSDAIERERVFLRKQGVDGGVR